MSLFGCRHRRIGWPRGNHASCLECGARVEIKIFQEGFHEKSTDSRWIERFVRWLFGG